MIALLQIPNLLQKGWWREIIAFAFFWSIGLILSIILLIKGSLPPITTIISESISKMFGI
jgi:hypothetical protein